jgi:hypothetical protein
MIKAIENIFETYSICKSIFICKDNDITKLYSTLKKHNFPVSKTCELNEFNDDLSRILLIDEVDARYFSILKNNLNLNDINYVIYCDKTIIKLTGLSPCINHIFI